MSENLDRALEAYEIDRDLEEQRENLIAMWMHPDLVEDYLNRFVEIKLKVKKTLWVEWESFIAGVFEEQTKQIEENYKHNYARQYRWAIVSSISEDKNILEQHKDLKSFNHLDNDENIA